MYKQIIWTTAAALLLALMGCVTETTPSTTSTVPTTPTTLPNGSTKITSLQAVIDAANAGAVIDLSSSEYADITYYKATINKSLTLQNGSDLKGASLTVSSDGVTLNAINSAGVTTGSSLKIANSSLSSLTIASVSSSGLLSNVEVNGRGDNSGGSTMLTDRTSTGRSGRTSAQPPVVEVDNTEVDGEVSVGIANAYLTVEKFTAKKNVCLDAANVQLTINDKATNIKEIKTDKICQVILEDGTSDTIPCTTDKITVTGSGELKQIDMTAKDSKKLIALTPVGGLTTAIQKDESIDFGTAVVLGTYQQTDGVAVFTNAGLSYNFTETFSKLEKDFVRDKSGSRCECENYIL